MNAPIRSNARCRNEGCSKPADAGEFYCFACGLERSLYERDSRPSPVNASARRAEEERRR
jgi:hypothetical protein